MSKLHRAERYIGKIIKLQNSPETYIKVEGLIFVPMDYKMYPQFIDEANSKEDCLMFKGEMRYREQTHALDIYRIVAKQSKWRVSNRVRYKIVEKFPF